MPGAAPKRTTIVDVAKAAKVAVSSASAAINGRPGVSQATRSRILAVADELGFVPSLRGRSLSSNRAFAVGLVIQRDINVLEEDPFFGSFITGIEEVIASRDYALVLQVSHGEQETLERYRKLALNRRVDGVFLNELRVDDPRVRLLRKLDFPAVAINAADDLPVPTVRQHAEGPMRNLTATLVNLGHTRFAHISGPSEFVHSQLRYKAWRGVLTEAGLDATCVVDGEFTYRGGEEAAHRIMRGPDRPTAVVCASDLMALGFIRGCLDLGLGVPDDVSVTGYDGISMGVHSRPQLTTARTNPRQLASVASEMLLDVIGGVQVANRTIPPAEIVGGQSIGPCPCSVVGV